eukprot:174980_1
MFVSSVGNKSKMLQANFGCNTDKFFGEYGVENPTFSLSDCNANSTTYGDMAFAGIIIKLSGINLTANKQYKFYIMFGYIPNGFDLNELIQKYNSDDVLNNLLETTAKSWYQDAIKFNTTSYPEIAREILWDYGYLRSTLTFYDLYNEYILDQGTGYRYISGFQGAFRDPLQHILPFIFTSTDKFKSIIRYHLKQIQPTFNDMTRFVNVPWGLTGNGIIYTTGGDASDLELYLLYVISEYILATRDIQFLSEKIDLNVFGDTNSYGNYTILDCLIESYQFLHSHIGIGRHGVIRVQSGDWNDGIATMENNNYIETLKKAESGLNTAMLTYVLPKFITVLNMIGINKQSMHE